MGALDATAFAAVLWGSLVGVLAVFLFEVYVVGRDAGWFG